MSNKPPRYIASKQTNKINLYIEVCLFKQFIELANCVLRLSDNGESPWQVWTSVSDVTSMYPT